MLLVIAADGAVRFVYDERLDLASLGAVAIQRASHVEPTPAGQWTADLTPVGGPVLGAFTRRSEALDAERAWLDGWLGRSADAQPRHSVSSYQTKIDSVRPLSTIGSVARTR